MIRKLSRILVISVLSIGLVTTYVRDVNNSPSKYELAAEKLGFNQEQQKALLKIYNIAGYFKPDKALEDLSKSEIFATNAKLVFDEELLPAIRRSNATDANPATLNVDKLKHNLFGRSKNYFWKRSKVSENQVEDWILYLAQNGFARNAGQERNELISENWMDKYKTEYIEAAKILGMIDRINPPRKEYDECWIAGASRLGTLARLLDFKNTISTQVTIKGATKILAGNRPIWAEIDGISDDTWQQLKKCILDGQNMNDVNITISSSPDNGTVKEGTEFIIDLAKKYNIKLDPKMPTIKYTTKEECPSGMLPGRTYPNYADPNEPKITETLMSEYLLDTIIGKDNLSITDTKSQNNDRPTTETTAATAMEEFIAKIPQNNTPSSYYILLVSNNPYIERQALASHRQIVRLLKKYKLDEKIYNIAIDGAGFGYKQDVATVNSELGALMAEKWLLISNDRPSHNLMYQTRNNR